MSQCVQCGRTRKKLPPIRCTACHFDKYCRTECRVAHVPNHVDQCLDALVRKGVTYLQRTMRQDDAKLISERRALLDMVYGTGDRGLAVAFNGKQEERAAYARDVATVRVNGATVPLTELGGAKSSDVLPTEHFGGILFIMYLVLPVRLADGDSSSKISHEIGVCDANDYFSKDALMPNVTRRWQFLPSAELEPGPLISTADQPALQPKRARERLIDAQRKLDELHRSGELSHRDRLCGVLRTEIRSFRAPYDLLASDTHIYRRRYDSDAENTIVQKLSVQEGSLPAGVAHILMPCIAAHQLFAAAAASDRRRRHADAH